MGIQAAVTASLPPTLPVGCRDSIQRWLREKNSESVEGVYRALQEAELMGQRYVCPEVLTQRVANRIFELAFQHHPAPILGEGKRRHPLSCRHICRVKIPQMLAAFLRSPYVKGVVCVSSVLFVLFKGFAAYKATAECLRGRVLPFVLNTAPLSLIRVFNRVIGGIEHYSNSLYRRKWTILLSVAALKYSSLEIPYLTNLARKVSIKSLVSFLFFAPWTLGWEAGLLVFNAVSFIPLQLDRGALVLEGWAQEEGRGPKEEARQQWLQKVV